MTLNLLFWILMLLWLVFGIVPTFPRGEKPVYWPFAGSVLMFVLVGLLGWQTFGPAIHH